MLLFRPTLLLSAAKRTAASANARRPAKRAVVAAATTSPAATSVPPPVRPAKRPVVPSPTPAPPPPRPSKKPVAQAGAPAPVAPPSPRPVKRPVVAAAAPTPPTPRPVKKPPAAPAQTPAPPPPRPWKKPVAQAGAPAPVAPPSPRPVKRPVVAAAAPTPPTPRPVKKPPAAPAQTPAPPPPRPSKKPVAQAGAPAPVAPPSPRPVKRPVVAAAAPTPPTPRPVKKPPAAPAASAPPSPKPAKKQAAAAASAPVSPRPVKQPAGTRARSQPKKPATKAKSPPAPPPAALPAPAPAAVPVTPKIKPTDFVPDYRERVLQIFQQLAEINKALDERYKASSYVVAVERLKRNDYIYMNFPPNIMPPGVNDEERKRLVAKVKNTTAMGDKLREKIVEILTTGDLAELHLLQQTPLIRAVRELTQVHGVGPRTAVIFFKKHGLKTVEELRKRVEEQEANEGGKGSSGDKSALKLTEAQRLGLKYYSDITQRIPHAEVRLHEAFLKLRLRKYLGKSYELAICGSYRRRLATSGDIDVLITRKIVADEGATPQGASEETSREKDGSLKVEKQLEPQEVLAAFVSALKEERYIEATLAQGATKFMGVSRLKSYKYNAGTANPRMYPARRLDIRFVEPECFPAALLYFTGSKNFNVVMRAEAIKRNFILNEYGLFRNDATGNEPTSSSETGGRVAGDGADKGAIRGRWSAEAFQKLVRANYYSAKSPAFVGTIEDAVDDEKDGEAAVGKNAKGSSATSRKQKQQQAKELAALWREVEARRVKVKHEREIFAALGMAYVHPEKRDVGTKTEGNVVGADKKRRSK
ncbi:mitochondrial DNA polymerase beta-PAK [Trypanosoma brucei brucei TREU927]|uniref:Mitochondrial DNA polymerase beta-PAK n=1 Tax=Trypanosoma brucei brucei (strain 927/4 GUTat10.1) TaxID=185431 RepID=Q57ZV5_TRYB2|nr:mitochondrial DNA polymerase beta-PAK [Trypanosoma brucei brucei TREU927]AAX79360.1 mitochondrial DNA polymerase beta-PAK [Trypanosoma brucei]AAZ11392.1 mitochondrial DNA polymerase beta-PAK [Trypanosoma brucei brucei TREU927]